jgi:hypothetical protein
VRSKPFNFMVGIRGKSFTVAVLEAGGVRPISLATSLHRAAMSGLLEAARQTKEQRSTLASARSSREDRDDAVKCEGAIPLRRSFDTLRGSWPMIRDAGLPSVVDQNTWRVIQGNVEQRKVGSPDRRG